MKTKTSKAIMSIFLATLLIFASVGFALAEADAFDNTQVYTTEDINDEIVDASDIEVEDVEYDTEIEVENVANGELERFPAIKKWVLPIPVFFGNGFIENEDRTEGYPVRVVVTKGSTIQVRDVQRLREEYGDDNEQIREALQEQIAENRERVKGKLTIGSNENQEHFRLLLKESSENYVEFYVFSLKDKPEAISSEDVESLEEIGILTATRTEYEKGNLRIWRGTLEIKDGEYEGEWDITVHSVMQNLVVKAANKVNYLEDHKPVVAEKIEAGVLRRAEQGQPFFKRLAMRLGLIKNSQ